MRTERGVGLWPPVKGARAGRSVRCSDLLAVVGASRREIRGGPTEHDVGAQRVEGGAWCRVRTVRWPLEEPAHAAWDGADRGRRYRRLAGWSAGVWVVVLRMA
jgi:hypothetical protein